MFQVKILKANQIDILEELMNRWLMDQKELNIVDIKFNNYDNSGMNEHVAIMIYQTA